MAFDISTADDVHIVRSRIKSLAQDPEVIARLSRAYEEWFGDVRKVPIVRPLIAVGHSEWPETKLTVPEARFTDHGVLYLEPSSCDDSPRRSPTMSPVRLTPPAPAPPAPGT